MRFTPEHRGEDFEDEWCVVDENICPVGSAICFGMEKKVALTVADALNDYFDTGDQEF